jgi:hypothetical protein
LIVSIILALSAEKWKKCVNLPHPSKHRSKGKDTILYQRTIIDNGRLQKKIMEPYNTAKPLHTASANLHSTLVILRAATYYLHLSRRLSLQIAETHPQSSSVDPHALLRAAVTISELSHSPPPKPPTLTSIQTNSRLCAFGSPRVGKTTYHPISCK